LKISEKELLSRLKTLGVKTTKVPFLKYGYYYESKFSLASTSEYLQGYIYIQEAASQLPAQVLNPLPGENVLDMCASPGSKTTQIAQLMENKGLILCTDTDSRRLKSLRNNLERCDVANAILYKKDARFINDFGKKYDKILLDAPCSGNYVIEEKFFQEKNIHGIMERSRMQKELLKAAVKSLNKGGLLVYSTCSLEPEEDEMNIDWLLQKYPELELEETGIDIGDPGLVEVFGKKLNSNINKTRRFWPEKTGTEGFYIAKIRKP
jgi:NOL1/NOP2/sun family putative RNA methylase